MWLSIREFRVLQSSVVIRCRPLQLASLALRYFGLAILRVRKHNQRKQFTPFGRETRLRRRSCCGRYMLP